MPRNPVQFQPGLSLPAFLEQHGMQAQCQAALFQHRWSCAQTVAIARAAGCRGGSTNTIAAIIRPR